MIDSTDSSDLSKTGSTRDPGAAHFHLYLLRRIVARIYQGPTKRTGKNAASFSLRIEASSGNAESRSILGVENCIRSGQTVLKKHAAILPHFSEADSA